jgi:hypothetical protein
MGWRTLGIRERIRVPWPAASMTATMDWLRSARLCLITAVLLAATACAATVPPAAGKGGAASDVRSATASPAVPGGKGGSPSPIAGVVDPSVRCVSRLTGAAMVLIGQALYDVTDPVHPRLVCVIGNTSTQLFTADTFEYIRRSGTEGTEVVLHSIGSGNEKVVAGWPLKLMNLPMGGYGVWTPDGNNAATFVAGTDASGNATIQVWLFAQPNKTELYEFPQPLTDCICRFGLPPPTLAFSADGRYLVSGWPIGKGATPLRVYRVADASLVVTLTLEDTLAIWSPTGDRLYASGSSGSVATWAPDDRLLYLADTPVWPYMAGMSPDGKQVAYTAYADPTNLRVYVFDIATQSTRMLIDQSRSEVTFVKDGWVWYLEEAPCANCPGQSGPTERVFAMRLADGAEQTVVFAKGEGPTEVGSRWAAGVFWPNS